MIRVRGQAGVMHALYLGVRLQALRKCHRICIVALHAKPQRLRHVKLMM
jgi:hypothetical protein